MSIPGMSNIPIGDSFSSIQQIAPPFPLWLYRYLAAFPVSGLLGLDHMAIGSTFTGLTKLIVNMLTLGSWYAFDIVQVYNLQNIRDKGLSVPFFETGGIGKGRINDEPMQSMSKNTQLWIFVLFICVFGGLYYISTFFLSTGTDLISTIIYYFSTVTFFITVALMCYTAFFYLFGKQTNAMPSTSQGALSALYRESGVLNPKAAKALPKSNVQSVIGMLPAGMAISRPFIPSGIRLGGSYDEIKSIADSVIQSGGSHADNSYGHYYFALLLSLLPLSGFFIYYLKKQENEAARRSKPV